jgi:hypothetical protein
MREPVCAAGALAAGEGDSICPEIQTSMVRFRIICRQRRSNIQAVKGGPEKSSNARPGGYKMRYLLDKITGIFLFYFQGCLFRGALQIHDKFHLKGEPCMSKGMDAKKAEKKEPQNYGCGGLSGGPAFA